MNRSTITFDMSTDLRSALAGLRPEVMQEAIRQGLNDGAQYVIDDIKKNRLNGKGPFPVEEHRLGVGQQVGLGGRLRKSLWASPARVDGDSISLGIGAAVVYAKVHEFGFNGEVTVKEHKREAHTIKRQKRGEITIDAHMRKGKGVKEHIRKAHIIPKQERPEGVVKEHTMHMHMPERAPIRTGIAENLDVFTEEIGNKVIEVMKTA